MAGAVEYTNCISAEIYPPNSNECSRYDIKQCDGEAPALEIWGMWNTPSLPLLPGPLRPEVIAPDRVLSMGQIEQTMCKQMTDVKCDLHSNTGNHLNVSKKRAQAHLRMLSTKYVYKSYIFNVYV